MEQKEVNYLTSYKFGDFFDKAAKMAKHTFKSSMLLYLAILLPAIVVYSASLLLYFNSFVELFSRLSSRDYNSLSNVWNILPSPLTIILFIIGSLIYTLAFYFASACITLKAYRKAHGEESELKELVGEVYREKFLPILGQLLLKGAIMMGVILIPLLFLIGGPILFRNSSPLILITVFIGLFLLIAAYVVVIWLAFAFYFSAEAIVIDNSTVTGSLKRSFYLVKGNWWRVFGILLVFNLIISMIASTVSGPIFSVFMLSDFGRYFESIISSGNIDRAILELYTAIFTKMGIPTAISVALQSAVYIIVYPLIQALFYIDLKIRKGELESKVENRG